MNRPERESLERHQLERLDVILDRLRNEDRGFYGRRSSRYREGLRALEELRALPLISKADLSQSQTEAPPYGLHHLRPLAEYVRVHRTSGTTARPLFWLDTEEDWSWWKRCWVKAFEAAGFRRGSSIFFPVNPAFAIGVTSAWDAAQEMGIRVFGGAAISLEEQLELIEALRPHGLVTAPTYCFRLLEQAAKEGRSLAQSSIERLVVLGEPGGSLPAVRARLEEGFGAEVFDNYGSTDLGTIAYQCRSFREGFHLNEEEFLCEVLDPETQQPVPVGQVGELVVTNLGRLGAPLIRYRSGDLVRLTDEPCACGSFHVRCVGGILSRADDLIIIGAYNLYPSALEEELRAIPGLVEFRCEVRETGADSGLKLELELEEGVELDPGGVEKRLGRTFHVPVTVRRVPEGTLPRSKRKSRRFCRIQS